MYTSLQDVSGYTLNTLARLPEILVFLSTVRGTDPGALTPIVA